MDDEIVRNDSALVAQTTFHVNGQQTKLILGADLSHSVWDDIVRITRYYNREDRLEWDIFKISHHCSYKALSDDKGKEKTVPVERVVWLFEQGNEGGVLVSSSKPIPATDTIQPPHRQAANYYKEVAGNIDGEFIVTMEHPKESAPEPLVIIIDASGATFKKISIGAVGIISSRPAPRAG